MPSYVIYALELEGETYYVGVAEHAQGYEERELTRHREGKGPCWTQLHPPLHFDGDYSFNPFELDKWVKIYMIRHGIDSVRGGSYESVTLDKADRVQLEKEVAKLKWEEEGLCLTCGRDEHYTHHCRETIDVNGNETGFKEDE